MKRRPAIPFDGNIAYPCLAPDGRTLYFCTDRRGKQEIFSVDAGFLDELHPRLAGDSGKR